MAEAARAAVLVPVTTGGDGEGCVVVIRRAEAGRHGGEIGLPGGIAEPGDADLAATAVRETIEELGVAAAAITVIETLPRVATHVTGFTIQPYLARLERPGQWAPDEREVAAVHELRVRDLAAVSAHTREDIDYGSAGPLIADCLRVGDIRIWGATRRILAPLLERLAREPQLHQ